MLFNLIFLFVLFIHLGHYGSDCKRSCPVGCKEGCDKSTGTCMLCKDGFYGKSCESRCPTNCVSCSSHTRCTKCRDGYLSAFGCKSLCRKSCNSCAIADPSKCTQCSRGVYSKVWFNDSLNNLYSTCEYKCPKYCIHGFCNGTSGECTDGCVDGYTGSKCCPVNCRLGQCDQETGKRLPYRCSTGYSGSKCNCGHEGCADSECTSCINNKWFWWRYKCCKCSSTCKDGLCFSNGTCLDGCIDGFYGATCEQRCMDLDKKCVLCEIGKCSTCLSGFYPEDSGTCVRCSDKCASNTCNATDGTCIEGCFKGYWGQQCSSNCSDFCLECDKNSGLCNVCEEGRFKRNCSSLCTDSCFPKFENPTCDIDSGACKHSCSNTSRYGDFCDKDCRHTCVDTKCDWGTGNCTKGCISQYYGRQCQNKCNKNCLSNQNGILCDPLNGNCTFGCLDGFWGNQCNSSCGNLCLNCDRHNGICNVCKEGHFNRNCSFQCTDNCLKITESTICDIDSGACKHGCSNTSRYGDFCDKDCGKNCINKTCDWKTAVCTHGCVKEYFGQYCNSKCNSNCISNDKETSCYHNNGTCIYGCLDGFQGHLCDTQYGSDGDQNITTKDYPESIRNETDIVILIILYASLFGCSVVGLFVAVYCVLRRKRITEEQPQKPPTSIPMEMSARDDIQEHPESRTQQQQFPTPIAMVEWNKDKGYEDMEDMNTGNECEDISDFSRNRVQNEHIYTHGNGSNKGYDVLSEVGRVRRSNEYQCLSEENGDGASKTAQITILM